MPFEFGEPASAGDTVQLTCHVTKGDMPLTIAWYFDGRRIEPHMGVVTSMFGHRTHLLSISNVRQSHIGRYICVATNQAGSAEYSADLHVNGTTIIKHVVKIALFFFVFSYYQPCPYLK